MPDLLIRNVDPLTVEAFKNKAELNKRSLNEELKQLLGRNRSYSREEAVGMIGHNHRLTIGGPLQPLTLDEIREGAE